MNSNSNLEAYEVNNSMPLVLRGPLKPVKLSDTSKLTNQIRNLAPNQEPSLVSPQYATNPIVAGMEALTGVKSTEVVNKPMEGVAQAQPEVYNPNIQNVVNMDGTPYVPVQDVVIPEAQKPMDDAQQPLYTPQQFENVSPPKETLYSSTSIFDAPQVDQEIVLTQPEVQKVEPLPQTATPSVEEIQAQLKEAMGEVIASFIPELINSIKNEQGEKVIQHLEGLNNSLNQRVADLGIESPKQPQGPTL